MAVDRVKEQHYQLLTDISDEIGNSGLLYENFVEHMKPYAPPGLLNSKKTLLGKFELLQAKGSLNFGKYDVLKSIAEKSGNINIKELIEKAEEKINPSKKASTESFLHKGQRQYYDNTGKKGFLLILYSKEDREGTEKDVEKLKQFYVTNGLGFEEYQIKDYGSHDLTTNEVEVVLKDVRDYLNNKTSGQRFYCFVCVILSHGDKKGIKTKDGLKSIEEIRSCFSNKNMPNFTGIPKVFFIQACRGYRTHYEHAIDLPDAERRTEAERNEFEDKADEADGIISVPTDADTLVAFATTQGRLAYRDTLSGSWFITECMDVFNTCHRNDHLEEMLITVRLNVALKRETGEGQKQMPCVWSTLTKRLMFT